MCVSVCEIESARSRWMSLCRQLGSNAWTGSLQANTFRGLVSVQEMYDCVVCLFFFLLLFHNSCVELRARWPLNKRVLSQNTQLA